MGTPSTSKHFRMKAKEIRATLVLKLNFFTAQPPSKRTHIRRCLARRSRRSKRLLSIQQLALLWTIHSTSELYHLSPIGRTHGSATSHLLTNSSSSKQKFTKKTNTMSALFNKIELGVRTETVPTNQVQSFKWPSHLPLGPSLMTTATLQRRRPNL